MASGLSAAGGRLRAKVAAFGDVVLPLALGAECWGPAGADGVFGLPGALTDSLDQKQPERSTVINESGSTRVCTGGV